MRRGQTGVSTIVSAKYRRRVTFCDERLGSLNASLVIPKKIWHDGIALYLHGGGYCSGDLGYAKCFASMLADKCGVKVYTVEYRLSPEAPFPAALEDCLTAYTHLLEEGYRGCDIIICGESAGGGLCYSLCLRLKEIKQPLPAAIVAISPWVDLTATAKSYTTNKESDISLSAEQLELFASQYTSDLTNPLVSPLFGDLTGLPPSLIFAGESEILLDDSISLNRKLLDSGCESRLKTDPGMWHAYLMYDLNEKQDDYADINNFISGFLKPSREKIWLRLDNSAKIYPAARSRNWSNLFRLSATLNDDVDPKILKAALGVTVRRFPSMAVRLSNGAFWYYLQELSSPPEIGDEFGHPIELMKISDIRKCAFRVLVYGKRIAVEFFHSITDGNGGLIFLKTLLAEYCERKYGKKIPCTDGVFDRYGDIEPGELDDDFLKYAGDVPLSRRESNAFHLDGVPESDGFVHALTFVADADEVHRLAKQHGVSVTAFLCAVQMQALADLQKKRVADRKKRKPIKVLLPVNLRNIFPSNSLRNFVLYITPEITPAMGDYTFDEICRSVHCQMGLELTANRMRARITTNVNDEKSFIVKIMPLFIKNAVMKGVFNAVGEKKCSLTMSNLGVVKVPEELAKHIERMDFTINVPATSHHNSAVISYEKKIYISFVRNSCEPELERRFHEILRDMGLRMKVESNSRQMEK